MYFVGGSDRALPSVKIRGRRLVLRAARCRLVGSELLCTSTRSCICLILDDHPSERGDCVGGGLLSCRGVFDRLVGESDADVLGAGVG